MKKLKFLIIKGLILISICFVQCTKDETEGMGTVLSEKQIAALSFSHSMKGYEIYSWPNGTDWNFSILIGTNRTKTLEEVTTNNVLVTGKASLKLVLDKFPLNEKIFWIGEGWLKQCWGGRDYGNLCLPDENTINEIKNYCVQKGLVLGVAN